MVDAIRARTINETTSVWQNGLKEWTDLSKTKLADKLQVVGPPALKPDQISNGFAWALAFAPLWGTLLHYTGAYVYLAFKLGSSYQLLAPLQIESLVDKTWYVVWGINVVVAALDEAYLKAAGWTPKQLRNWLVAIVPIYLYKRDQLLKQGNTRFLVWMGCFFISLLPIW
jgi:hypothetical protein